MRVDLFNSLYTARKKAVLTPWKLFTAPIAALLEDAKGEVSSCLLGTDILLLVPEGCSIQLPFKLLNRPATAS